MLSLFSFFKLLFYFSFTWEPATNGNPDLPVTERQAAFWKSGSSTWLKNLLLNFSARLPSQHINLSNALVGGERNGSAVPHLLLPLQQGTESAYMA